MPDQVIPVDTERDVHGLLGVFLSLRHAVPLLASHTADLHSLNDAAHHRMRESFGQKTAEAEVRVSTEQLVQVRYDPINATVLCLGYKSSFF